MLTVAAASVCRYRGRREWCCARVDQSSREIFDNRTTPSRGNRVLCWCNGGDGLLKAQSKLELTPGEFISVNSTHGQAATPWPCTLLISRHMDTNNHAMLLLSDKSVNKQPFCQQNSFLIMCC